MFAGGLDYFAVGSAQPTVQHKIAWQPFAVTAGAGVLGSLLWTKHPVLGFLGASALGSNVFDVARGSERWQTAGRRLGKHVVAVAGSLAMPHHPMFGYIAGAVAGDLLIDGDGSGVIESWARVATSEPEHIEIRTLA